MKVDQKTNIDNHHRTITRLYTNEDLKQTAILWSTQPFFLEVNYHWFSGSVKHEIIDNAKLNYAGIS